MALGPLFDLLDKRRHDGLTNGSVFTLLTWVDTDDVAPVVKLYLFHPQWCGFACISVFGPDLFVSAWV
jgi:hypothetical protein